MMVINVRVPRSRVVLDEMKLTAFNSSLMFCWEPSDEVHTDPAVPKPLELSNYGSNINAKGSSQLIAPFDII